MAQANKPADSNASDKPKEVPSNLPKEGSQAVPTNTNPVPIQVVSRDELTRPEYTLHDNGTLDIERGRPNAIFDNQRNQQAQENTVEVNNGIRNQDGTLKENHPVYDDAADSVKE